ncbi:MAG TPA: hypothetical protein VFS02_24665 [Telluria sp.]|nr:hypothetical protein [Telluria sp.]
MPLVHAILGVALLAGFIVLFKPLLTGIVRALVLTVRPRLSKDELAARRHMRDAKMLQRMINSSQGPSHAAELRALGSRA